MNQLTRGRPGRPVKRLHRCMPMHNGISCSRRIRNSDCIEVGEGELRQGKVWFFCDNWATCLAAQRIISQPLLLVWQEWMPLHFSTSEFMSRLTLNLFTSHSLHESRNRLRNEIWISTVLLVCVSLFSLYSIDVWKLTIPCAPMRC